MLLGEIKMMLFIINMINATSKLIKSYLIHCEIGGGSEKIYLHKNGNNLRIHFIRFFQVLMFENPEN
jgi:hypothetical protein